MEKAAGLTPKEILRLALPAILAGIAEPLISLTDVAVVGNLEDNSVNALLAVGLVGSFLSAIIWTLAQTKTSVSAIVSRHYGSDTLGRTKSLIPQVIWLNIATGAVVYILTAIFAPQIFVLYKAGDALSLTVDYYRIRAIGFPMTLATFAIFGIFRGIQNTSWAMTASLLGAAVNVVLDYLLVYGYEPYISGMGLNGAAYASLAAQVVMLGIALLYFFSKTPYGKQTRWSEFFPTLKPHPLLKEHVMLTANFFVRTLAINVAIYLSYRYASGYGNVAGATHAILMNIWLFFSFFVDGFANAGNALGGRFLGAGDRKNLRYLGNSLTWYGVSVAIILVLACLVAYDWLGWRFTSDEPVHAVYVNTFWIVLAMQPINAVAFVYDGIFKGWGEAAYLRNLLLMLTALVFIPVLLVCDSLGWELRAVWAAFFAWMVGRAAVLWWEFRKRLKHI